MSDFHKVDLTDHEFAAIVHKHGLVHQHVGSSTLWREGTGGQVQYIVFFDNAATTREIRQHKDFDPQG